MTRDAGALQDARWEGKALFGDFHDWIYRSSELAGFIGALARKMGDAAAGRRKVQERCKSFRDDLESSSDPNTTGTEGASCAGDRPAG